MRGQSCVGLGVGKCFQRRCVIPEEYESLTKPVQQINCSDFSEEQCRSQPSCILLGSSEKAFLETGGEVETFRFEECVDRVPQYADCQEVVRMTQMYAGSQFPKECRCCCGEGPFCKEKPYPEK